MLESNLTILLRQVLLAGLTDRGYPAVLVKSAYQPRQQGVPTPATIFTFQTGWRRYGYPKKEYIFNSTSGAYDYVETQIVHSKYQIAGLNPQSPATPTAATPSDLLRIAGDILQHNDALATFLLNDVGILRIIDGNTIYFENDKGQNDANPTFEITLSHEDVFTKPGVAITIIEENIFRI